MIEVLRRLGHAVFRQRYGDAGWDTILRLSILLGLITIPLSLYRPHAATLPGFVIVTIWVNGPLSPLLPATYEPILMLMGRLYPPLLVAALGTIATVGVEYLNYHLYRRIMFTRRLQPVREGKFTRRVVALFQGAPFFTIWLCSWSPLPYWIVRFLSPLAGYPVDRQLLATLLGRFPRLWFFAALGIYWRIGAGWLLLITLGSILLGIVAWSLAARRSRAADE